MVTTRMFFKIPTRRIKVWKAEATVDLTEKEYKAAIHASCHWKSCYPELNGIPFVIGPVSSRGLRNMPTMKAFFKTEQAAEFASKGKKF